MTDGLIAGASSASPDAGAAWPVYPTKALAKFLSSLNARSQRLLLDLGPVVGTNVTFFGEELGCKIHVEDLFKVGETIYNACTNCHAKYLRQ